MYIYIDRDHNAVEYADAIVSALSLAYEVVFLNSSIDIPYPLIAEKLTNLVSKNEGSLGILICKTGIGMSIVANKTNGIYAQNCSTIRQCYIFKRNNMGNVLCLGASIVGIKKAIQICETFIKTEFDNKNINRINLIKEIEKRH